MTEYQKESREERIAICMFDGHLTEEEAEQVADAKPSEYGVRPIEWKQKELLK